jgi:hypothetical protein
VLARLQSLSPKTNPLTEDPAHANLSLTPRRKAINESAKVANKDVTFDPTITCKDEIAEGFRIFTTPERISIHLAQCLRNE